MIWDPFQKADRVRTGSGTILAPTDGRGPIPFSVHELWKQIYLVIVKRSKLFERRIEFSLRPEFQSHFLSIIGINLV